MEGPKAKKPGSRGAHCSKVDEGGRVTGRKTPREAHQ